LFLAGGARAVSAAPRVALRKPPRLRDGDLVGLVSPGGVTDDALLQRCVANLEGFGLRVKLGRNVRAAHGGYAGTVAQRAEDLHAMFADREVRAVWAARGGSGTSGLLPHLDYGLLRANPKIVVGYSDMTALHLALLARAGLVSFHGPVASSRFSDFSATFLRAVLMDPRPRLELLPSAEDDAEPREAGHPAPGPLRAGVAEGPLLGGNLSMVAALAGTPYLPPAAGAIVFLEDVQESPYRIDRMLTQLAQAGVTSRASGIAFGYFRKCVSSDDSPQLTLAQFLAEQVAALGKPAAFGLALGHIPRQVTIPLGIRARFDAGTRVITLLEPAVA
jgi:muramoyltetrapeptide carboxypeptidase